VSVTLAVLACAGAFGCSRADRTNESGRRTVSTTASADTDDFGAALPLDASSASRVVSLNPTATEIIFAIGADDRLVGRGSWDTFPPDASRVPAVGDDIRPNIEAVLRLRPTLVILYASADNRAAADAFAKAGVRTMTLRVDRIAQFMSLSRTLGIALGAGDRAASVIDSVQRTLDAVRRVTRDAVPRTVVWPVWQQPVMVIGGGSFLDELLEIAGGRNVFHELAAPSPQVSIEEIARRNPDVIVASPKGVADLRSRAQWRAVAAMRGDQFVTHDPDLTGRPSVVLGMAAVSLARALHPELTSQLPALPVPVAK
jgi:ABC-type Fe3+-hydroxamate transport system substrate-binding protein